MQFIRKDKDANKFKILDNISDFDKSEFNRYELYEVRQITPYIYDEKIKIKKIEELKSQLALLGVNLDDLLKPKATETVQTTQEELPDVNTWKETPLEEAKPQDTIKVEKGVTFVSSENKLSKIVNRATQKLFTMKELQVHFEKFKEIIEKDVPELMYCSYSENGFLLNMTEIKPNIPRMLQNGIPVRQIVE
jgi:hypothetical protein